MTGAYPYGQDVTNGSRETTVAEIIRIQGCDESVKRNAGMNMTAGTTNALEFVCSAMKAPTFNMMLKKFEADHTV